MISTKEKTVRSKTRLSVVVAGVALFTSGIAVGQRAGTSKFAKYLGPSVRTEMDWITLEASVDAIRDKVPQSGGIWIPVTYFNAKENRPEAFAMISTKLMLEPVETAKAQISEAYYLTYYRLKNQIPELSEDDFVLRVMSPTTDPTRRLFDECRHGSIVFH
jgi:hypothetical protein